MSYLNDIVPGRVICSDSRFYQPALIMDVTFIAGANPMIEATCVDGRTGAIFKWQFRNTYLGLVGFTIL